MADTKLIKDPVYGYIEIDCNLAKKIVDTPVFQRLRRIIQTSYTPLYPSSTHNRFSHSLGVYFLGKIAIKNVIPYFQEQFPNVAWQKREKIFLLACLLHDVGHAPFSHTGEDYFLENDYNENEKEKQRYDKIHKKLIEIVDKEDFSKDVPRDSGATAAHEIMSAIVGLSNFADFFNDNEEKEFFARCITGYTYKNETAICSAYNCIISLLNSKVIDVDRLDYLIRDAYFTGFETINIDYIRLLSAIEVVEIDDAEYARFKIGYNKNAISIIENVVYAHDAVRKWIQSHPTIIYDMYIIQHVIESLNKKFNDSNAKLFSEQSLSVNGHELPMIGKLSLLCDDDIIFLMKNQLDDPLSKEFFDRSNRRHPLWKSSAEYKAIFEVELGDGDILKKLETTFEDTERYLKENSDNWVINQEVVAKLEEEINKIEAYNDTSLDNFTLKKQKESKNAILKLLKCILKYAQESGCSDDFVLLKASRFYSGFNKLDFNQIPIVFPSIDKKNGFEFSKIVSTLNSKDDKPKEEFYYLFFNNQNAGDLNKSKLYSQLRTLFM